MMRNRWTFSIRWRGALVVLIAMAWASSLMLTAATMQKIWPTSRPSGGSSGGGGSFFLKPSYKTFWGGGSRSYYQPTYSYGQYNTGRSHYPYYHNPYPYGHYYRPYHRHYYPYYYYYPVSYSYVYNAPAPAYPYPYPYPVPVGVQQPVAANSNLELAGGGSAASGYGVQSQTVGNARSSDSRLNSADLGWSFLARGAHQAALAKFADAAAQQPDSGLRLIGYGLASALNGNYQQAVAAFRRAYHLDAKGTMYLPALPGVLDRVRAVANHYEAKTVNGTDESDSYFMLGALNYFLGKLADADDSLDKAEAAGDRTDSAKNLREILVEYAEIVSG